MFELVENRLYAYAEDSTLLVVVHKPADRPAVAASINRGLARIQEWCNQWSMLLNPNKTKALVITRSRTVNNPHGGLVLSGIFIHASSNLNILGMKFDSKLDFKDKCWVLILVSLREFVFWGWWSVRLWAPPCYYIAIIHLYSQSLSIVHFCGGQLLNVTFSFSRARCIWWLFFALIRVYNCCVINVMLLGYVCCTRLIQTQITAYSAGFDLLLPEFDIPSCSSSSSIGVWGVKV